MQLAIRWEGLLASREHVTLESMSETTARVRFTYDHYCQLPEGDRRELIDGEFYVTPAPTEKHQRICGNLYFELRLFLEKCPAGRAYTAPFDVILDRYSTVQPDLTFISTRRLGVLKSEGLRGAPDIAIEVLSPSTRSRDEELKRALYFKHGTRELWLVDPQEELVSVYSRQKEGLELWRTFCRGDELASPFLPELRISVDAIFR